MIDGIGSIGSYRTMYQLQYPPGCLYFAIMPLIDAHNPLADHDHAARLAPLALRAALKRRHETTTPVMGQLLWLVGGRPSSVTNTDGRMHAHTQRRQHCC
jgi:hypothetical protein